MKKINLTPEEVAKWQQLHKNEKNSKIKDRIKAILLINQGYSYKEVANFLFVDHDTIRRHVNKFMENEKLSNDCKGRISKLTPQQIQELVTYLKQLTFCDVRPIIAYVFDKYKIRYSKSGMVFWLHNHGFSYKKPHLVPTKLDQEKQEEYIEKLHELKKSGEPLYFIDAVHPEHQSKADYGWFVKGEIKSISTTATQKRIHILGALSYPSNELFIVEDQTINSQTVIEMLEKLKFKNAPRAVIHCVLDNAKYHKSKIIQEYIKDNPNIKLHYLPPYSPNLNLIERVWKLMHKEVTSNVYFTCFQSFSYAILSFLKNINNFAEKLKSLLTFKFQKLNYTKAVFVK